MYVDQQINSGSIANPNNKYFGWGNKDLQPAQNLAIETAIVENLPFACLARDAKPAGDFPAAVQKAIDALAYYDKGLDMEIIDKLVYKNYLMIMQNIGNCVGASHDMLLATRIALEILFFGDAEEPLGANELAIPFIPYSYGVGRWEGNMLGGGDGSYCGAQIKGTVKHGFLPCFASGLKEAYPSLPQSSSTVGRLFGRSLAEIKKWIDKATDFKLKEAPVADSEDDVWDLIVNKKIPLQICSGWGFTFRETIEGINVYRRGGSWSHSMQIVGAFEKKSYRFYKIRNQWGPNAHKDGRCFTILADEMAKWIRASETIGIGEVEGLQSSLQFA